jgi:TolB-like protein/class 3 adenylate cyclase
VAPEREERRLAAILAADMVGYSRLMEADERGTIARQKAHRKELIDPKIAKHNGRIVKTTGDGLLVEFASVVDAVRSAVAIQRAMVEREAEVPEDRRIRYRVGINTGDIVIDSDDILGSGVNVAARLEGLAEPGGICIPRKVMHEVRNMLDVGYEFTGEQKVKNIETPVPVYRVLLESDAAGKVIGERRLRRPLWQLGAVAAAMVAAVAVAAVWWQPWVRNVEPASLERMAFPLPDKPSIAVLPFTNMSDDASQEYFADGMTEDLITDLSKLSGLFVIARNSSFSYKGQAVQVRQVAEELGVRYVLEGSVRRAGDSVRINAQLIDATTGGHLWAERYDGTLADVFGLQDTVTESIVSALTVHLTVDDEARVTRRETDDVAAYDAFLQGWEHYRRRTPSDFAKAVGYFERAVELDPQYGRAYAALAIIYWKSWLWSVMTMSPSMPSPWTQRLDIPVVYAPDRANEYLEMAMRNPTPLAHQVASEMHWRDGRYDAAIAEAESAIALNPSDSAGYVAMAEALIFGGRTEEAFEYVERAMRLDPFSAVNLYLLGLGHFSLGQLEKAATLFERALERSPLNRSWKAPLAAIYAHMARAEEARAALGDYGGGYYTVQDIMDLWPFKDAEVAERFATGIVKAGVCCEEKLEQYLNDLGKARMAD